jgi:hypothetical protein
MSIIRPKPPTIEEEINRIKKNAEVVKKEAQKTLQNAILFYPDKKIVLEDQNKLIHGIKSLFSSFDEGAKNDEHMSDSVRLSLINDLLSHNYREPDTVGFHSIRNSIQCEFIMYSPSCQHFIAILTHKNTTPSFDINYYNGMVLFCEKKDCGIDVYPYSHPVSQYDKYTREIYTNEVISSHFNYMGNYFLKTEEYQEHLHPMKKGFWQDKFFFDTITIENKKYLRYQTSRKYRSTKNHGYMPRPMYQIR